MPSAVQVNERKLLTVMTINNGFIEETETIEMGTRNMVWK